MGFDLNFNNNQPMVQNAQKSQDGGAGNLGYMKRRKKGQGSEDVEIITGSVFEDAKDSFTHTSQEGNNSFDIFQFIEKAINYIKVTFERLFNSK